MPFNSENDYINDVVDNIKEKEPDYNWIDSPELKELVKWMLMKNPEDRPNAVDVLNHPYLKGDIWDRYEGKLYPDERIENFKRPKNTFVYFGQGLAL